MSPEYLSDLIRQTLYVALQISSPILIMAMLVGFLISIFQSVTQINEMTLTFVPKILIFALTVSILFPWILKTLTSFTIDIFVNHWNNISQLSKHAG